MRAILQQIQNQIFQGMQDTNMPEEVWANTLRVLKNREKAHLQKHASC